MKNLKDKFIKEVSKEIFGYDNLVELVLISILLRGNVLLHGMPGLGKTKLANVIAKICKFNFKRIQFTPDLMPADIIGSYVYDLDKKGKKTSRFIEGAIFTNLLLADEINRTPPKTQSALLEAMQEKQVSLMGETFSLPKSFTVIATENPLELEGTYQLPEAQMDRFLFCLNLDYPKKETEKEIIKSTTNDVKSKIKSILNVEEILSCRDKILNVLAADDVIDYAIEICNQSRPEQTNIKEVKNFVNYGAGPRGSQTLVLAAKGKAFLENRKHINFKDIKFVAPFTLRHRISCNYHAKSENIDSDKVIDILLKKISTQ